MPPEDADVGTVFDPRLYCRSSSTGKSYCGRKLRILLGSLAAVRNTKFGGTEGRTVSEGEVDGDRNPKTSRRGTGKIVNGTTLVALRNQISHRLLDRTCIQNWILRFSFCDNLYKVKSSGVNNTPATLVKYINLKQTTN